MIGIDEEGFFMTLSEFRGFVRAGAFVDDDGVGFLANSSRVSTVTISPSQIIVGKIEIDPGFTHVMWFNK